MPADPTVADWSYGRRKSAALECVLDKEWSITQACAYFGLDRASFYKHLKAERVKRGLAPTATQQRKIDEERRRKASLKMAQSTAAEFGEEFADPDGIRLAGGGPLDDQTKRIPTDPNEFNERYFGHFRCPDCEDPHTHEPMLHPSPKFHEEISEICQDPDVRRGVILTPPYHAKTTRATVRDTVYDIAHNPNSRTMIISETKPFASDILNGIKNLLENQEMYYGAQGNLINEAGPFFEPGQTWNNEQIFVCGRNTSEIAPTVQVLGYRGQIYGRRADKIKIDDIASYHNQANEEAVSNMLKWLDGQVLSRIGRNARCIWVGTRVRPGDIYETLIQRDGYKVMRYAAIQDEHAQKMLWPEHFPYDFARVRRAEMDAQQWELVYQNVDMLSVGTSFPPEAIERSKNAQRQVGQYDGGWFIFGGLDPAGAGPESGYTAFVLIGVEAATGRVHIIDAYREKQMKAPDIKAKILQWSDQYPMYEWRVERNGVQSQLVQYNEDILEPLGARGIRVEGHTTNQNKWDPAFGVESMAPTFTSGMVDIPTKVPNEHIDALISELRNFPYGVTSDLVMALWFAVIGARAVIRRPALPLFDERSNRRMPKRIRRQRHVIDFAMNEVTPIPLHDQDSRMFTDGKRQTVGRPTLYSELDPHPEEPEFHPFMNVEGGVYVDPT